MGKTSFECIKKSVQERADISIERIQSFMDKKYQYTMSLETDPFGTGRIWFIKMRKDSSCLILAVVTDANSISARQVMKNLSMMLLVMGFSVRPSSDTEFEFTREDFSIMKELEVFFTKSDFDVSYSFDSKEKLYSIFINNGENRATLIEVGGISERGISVLCKQIALILGGLGKHFSTSDGTIGNRYGIVEFCPTETAPEETESDDGEEYPF